MKNEFTSIGNVPKEKNKDLWNSFRDTTRIFNKQKNNFNKNLKSPFYSFMRLSFRLDPLGCR